MNDPYIPSPEIKPLPKTSRQITFYTLLTLFIIAIPFLYLYATGYRFEFGGEEGALVSTGGLYIAAEKNDASIYIDEELVRETWAFRQAFYAQGLVPGTHRVHVQKNGHHTWVKELPVYEHIVTEGQAFNVPVVPQVRIISPWRDAVGATILRASSTFRASTTNEVRVSTSTATSSLIADTEYASLIDLFTATSATSTASLASRVVDQFDSLFVASTTATSTIETATSTKEWRGVRIHERGDDLFASWVGTREDMPYYYCAEDFEIIGTSTVDGIGLEAAVVEAAEPEPVLIVGPLQYVPEDAECDPTIRIDRKWQEVKSFDFFPGSIDLVVVALESGVYVVEIDDRAWQNVQPILLGNDLDARVENGAIYVYDGSLIYHILLEE